MRGKLKDENGPFTKFLVCLSRVLVCQSRGVKLLIQNVHSVLQTCVHVCLCLLCTLDKHSAVTHQSDVAQCSSSRTDTSQYVLPSAWPGLTKLGPCAINRHIQHTILVLSDYSEVPFKKPQKSGSVVWSRFSLSYFRCTNQYDAVWFPISSSCEHLDGE